MYKSRKTRHIRFIVMYYFLGSFWRYQLLGWLVKSTPFAHVLYDGRYRARSGCDTITMPEY